MIELRVAHLLSSMHASAAASSAINLMRWLKAHDHEVVLLSGGGPCEQDCEREEIPVIRYQRKAGSPGWLLSGKRRFLREVEDWHPDLVHVHRLDAMPLAVDLARRLALPLVVSVHRAAEPREAEVLADPRVALVLVPSESLRGHYAGRLGLPRDRVAVLPYGLDLGRFPEPPERGPIEVVGAIGNFDEDLPGMLALVDAVAALRGEGLSLRALLVGSGAGRARIEARIAELGLEETIVLEGGRSETADVLARMDVFVYPVTSDSVSLGVIKSMAAGCPVVASAVGGIPELIQDGENGILVPAGDWTALTDALRRLAAEPEMARAMGRRGRQQVAERHDIDLVGEVAHELYRTALRGGNAGSRGTEAVTAWRRHAAARGDGAA